MGKMACFIAGNVWLLMSVVLWLGRKAVRFEPTRYAFFELGGWHSPFSYNLLIVMCVVVGLALLTAGMKKPWEQG